MQRPDTPLAETPSPIKIDNTYVKKRSEQDIKKDLKRPTVKYTQISSDVAVNRNGKSYSKKDSSDYKKGFNEMTSGSWDVLSKTSKPEKQGRDEAYKRKLNTPVDYFKKEKSLLNLNRK